jgi:single-strand DNA-binding protein
MINNVILVGYVGIDPEVKTLENGVKMARVRLATTEKLFNREKNEYVENTEWHNVTMWRGLADVADRYIHKGTQLYIEGKLRSRKYMKNDVEFITTEIIAEEVKMLGKKENAPQAIHRQAPPMPQPQIEPITSNEMPF